MSEADDGAGQAGDGDSAARGLAPRIAERLARTILLKLIRDRNRSAPEAQFAGELGVATVAVRDTLAILRAEGALPEDLDQLRRRVERLADASPPTESHGATGARRSSRSRWR